MPFSQYRTRHFNVPPQLIGGMAAQEEAVEKGRLALRVLEVLQDLGRNELWHRGHREKGSLPKRVSTSSRTWVSLPLGRQYPGPALSPRKETRPQPPLQAAAGRI